MENSNQIITILKEIFNKGLKNGAYNIDDVSDFLEILKKLEEILNNNNKIIDPIEYLDNLV